MSGIEIDWKIQYMPAIRLYSRYLAEYPVEVVGIFSRIFNKNHNKGSNEAKTNNMVK